MQTRRRFFAIAGSTACLLAIAPSIALAKPYEPNSPVEVFDKEVWAFVPLKGGLINIRNGQLFRFVDKETGQHDARWINDRWVWYGVAREDGHWDTAEDGTRCGGCLADWFEGGSNMASENDAWIAAGLA